MSERPKSRRRTLHRETTQAVAPPTVTTDLPAELLAPLPVPSMEQVADALNRASSDRQQAKPAKATPGALPSGPIRTRNPKGGSFGIDWSQITRWWPEIEAAAKEFGVPAERIAAHIVIESQGKPDAIQRNEG